MPRVPTTVQQGGMGEHTFLPRALSGSCNPPGGYNLIRAASSSASGCFRSSR